MGREMPGEPYDLAGKRLVFTNWYYIKPAFCWWYDKEGNFLDLKSSSYGPWEAEFQAKECPFGIRLAAQPAERMGPILRPEHPWEEKGVSISAVIHENGLYRGWGGCHSIEDDNHDCYFESNDGLHWERPNLGIVEFEGGCDNNFILNNPGSVFKDPSAPDDERYKGACSRDLTREEFEEYLKHRPDGWEPRADRAHKIASISGFVSPDGLRWKKLTQPLSVEHCDTQIVTYYDERLRKYVMYTRTTMVGPRSEKAPGEWSHESWAFPGRRAIGRGESEDFYHFPVSETIIEPGPEMTPSDSLYTNCRTTIPGAPDHHLMFPSIYHQTDDTTSVTFLSSHDGKLWHTVPGSPVLRTAAFGEWDGGCVFAHPNLIELPNGDFALPYTGFTFPHKYPRIQLRSATGYAVWPKGRLIALEAPERGEFTTVKIMPPGRKLLINALTQRAGSILVEVAGSDGKPISGRAFEDSTPIIGDRHWTPITWKESDDLGYKDGECITLRFRMDKAKIFGLEFR